MPAIPVSVTLTEEEKNFVNKEGYSFTKLLKQKIAEKMVEVKQK